MIARHVHKQSRSSARFRPSQGNALTRCLNSFSMTSTPCSTAASAPTTTIRPEVKAILYVLFTFFQNTRKRFFTARVNKGKTYKQSRCKNHRHTPKPPSSIHSYLCMLKMKKFPCVAFKFMNTTRNTGSTEKIWTFHSLNKTESPRLFSCVEIGKAIRGFLLSGPRPAHLQ